VSLGAVGGIRDAILIGQLSAREITEATLKHIHELDGGLNSFLTVADDQALAEAEALDRRTATEERPGPLWGVPFSVKDLYDTVGVRTTYGSRIYERHVPTVDAEIVARIRRAGGILVGKTNTPEFAIFIRTVNDLQPETVNPWDVRRTAGGSSGGSAASLAAGFTPIGVGSDGGGSVRIPAALCGLVGLLPSRGSVPRGGSRIGTRRFSAAGPMALNAIDATALWEVMRGPDVADPLSRGLAPPGVSGGPVAHHGARMRWIGESGAAGDDTSVVDVAHHGAQNLAAAVDAVLSESDLSLDSPRFADPFYTMMQSDRLATGGRELLREDATADLLTTYARHHFERGLLLRGDDYSNSLEMQLTATDHLLGLLDGFDILLTPTVAAIAPEIPVDTQELPEDARRGFVAFTFLMNYTGFPAATVPCGLLHGMPVGLQLIGRPGTEGDLLTLCRVFQQDVFHLPTAPPFAHVAR